MPATRDQRRAPICPGAPVARVIKDPCSIQVGCSICAARLSLPLGYDPTPGLHDDALNVVNHFSWLRWATRFGNDPEEFEHRPLPAEDRLEEFREALAEGLHSVGLTREAGIVDTVVDYRAILASSAWALREGVGGRCCALWPPVCAFCTVGRPCPLAFALRGDVEGTSRLVREVAFFLCVQIPWEKLPDPPKIG